MYRRSPLHSTPEKWCDLYMVAGATRAYSCSSLNTTFWSAMQREPDLTNTLLMTRRQAALPRGVGQSHEVFIARAENAEIWDVEGKR